jgi:hypothetical protein
LVKEKTPLKKKLTPEVDLSVLMPPEVLKVKKIDSGGAEGA